MPLIKGFGRLIKMIGLQILSGMALVAVNLLRMLQIKKSINRFRCISSVIWIEKINDA